MSTILPHTVPGSDYWPPPGQQTIDLKLLHPEATFLRILGVNYVHNKTHDDGDLYVTELGVPFIRHLDPRNWYAEDWFKTRRQRLVGTSTVYRLPTRPIEGHRLKSIDLVVKWSRVGQDVALDTFTLQRNTNAEFNTPFEEFARVMELRRGEIGPSHIQILTQKPLAIYVPPEQFQPWQTGRSRDKLLAKKARHPGVEIDVLRAYIMLYGWIEGLNAIEAMPHVCFDLEDQHRELEKLTHRVDQELASKGFVVADHKPTHFILRLHNGQVRMRRDGRTVYALVDYELLSRTADYEDTVRAAKRHEYLLRQKQRFLPRPAPAYPGQLKPANVLGVDYVYGRAESTKGMLWVVGRDPELFPYFLPERWRSDKQIRLSDSGQTYYAQTKDRVHLVWKVSRVGELPSGDLADPQYRKLLHQGFNNPFEEFALALKMMSKGVKTVYPRAIYMTASPGQVSGVVLDDRRFEQMKNVLTPDGTPVMPSQHDYILIWGYWRGLEDDAAVEDTMLWTPIDVAGAAAKGIITQTQASQIIRDHQAKLAAAGFVDSNLKPDHVLISYIPSGAVKEESPGVPESRQCNLALVREV